MHLEGWSIDGYGHFRDHQQRGLGPGLTVFHGPNEAGKSTLLAFIRMVLFGAVKQSEDRVPPLNGGRHGGRLFLETGEGLAVVERHLDRKEGVRLWLPGEREGTPDDLSALLGHASVGLYRSVFGFSLTELQDEKFHRQDGIQDRIFAGGLQGARNTAREALSVLARQNDGVHRARARVSLLCDLERQIREARESLEHARRESSRFGDFRKQEAGFEESLAARSAALSGVEHERQILTLLLELWPRWSERTELVSRLSELPSVPTFPDRAEVRLTGLLTRLDQAEAQHLAVTAEVEALKQRLEPLVPDDGVEALADGCLALHAGVAAFRQSLLDRTEARSSCQDLTTQLSSALMRLGPDWTRDRIQAFDASPVRRDEIRRHEEDQAAAVNAIREAGRAEREARQALEQAHREAEHVGTRLGELQTETEAWRERVEQAVAAHARAHAEPGQLERLIACWPAWSGLEQLRQQLATSPVVGPVPEKAETRLAEFRTRIEGMDTEIAAVSDELRAALRVVEAQGPDPLVHEHEAEIEALLREQPVFESWATALGDEADRVAAARRALDTALLSLGRVWDRERLERFDASLPRLDEVREHEVLLDLLERKVVESGQELAAAREARDAAHVRHALSRDRFEAGGPVPEITGLEGREEALLVLVRSLEGLKEARVVERDRTELFRKLDWMVKEHALETVTAWPSGIRRGLWALGTALLLTALVLAILLPGQLHLAGIVLVCGSIAVFVASGRKAPSAEAERARLELLAQHGDEARALEQARVAREQAEQRVLQEWQEFGGTGLPSTGDVELARQRTARDLDQARSRATARAQLVELRDVLDLAEARLDRATLAETDAREALDRAREVWEAWLLEANLESARSPRGALDLLKSLQEARRQLDLVVSGEARMAEISGRRQQFLARLAALPVELGGTLEVLRSRLESARTMRQERDRAEERVRSLEVRLEGARHHRDRVCAERADWLAAHEAQDADDLLDRLEQFRERTRLEDLIRERETALEARVGTGEEAREFLEELSLGNVGRWKVDLEARRAEVDRLTRLRDEANLGLGERLQERETLSVRLNGLPIELLEQALDRACQEHEGARQASVLAQQAWEAWLRPRGLDPALTPPGTLVWFQEVREALGRIPVLEQAEARVADLELRLVRFRERALELLERGGGGMPSPGSPPEEADRELLAGLEALHGRVLADRELRQQRERLVSEVALAEGRLEEAVAGLAALEREREQLLQEGDAHDLDEFRQRMERVAERAELSRQLTRLDRELEGRLGLGEEAERLRERLESGDVQGWRLALVQAGTRAEELGQERDALNRELGALRETMRELEMAADVISQEHILQALIEEFRQQARSWQVRALARALVQDTLREVERTAQPEVLRHASALFERVTAGHHVRLEQHDTGDLRVVDRHEQRLEVRDLSRGTAEQLYLCVRLGLIEKFARDQVALPVVMDDVFVNFDPDRAREVAGAIARFAERHQVLVFTCHPTTAELLTSVQPGTPVIELPRHGGHAGPRLLRLPATATVPDVERIGREEGDEDVPRTEACERIVACLQQADEPLGKGELLRRTGLPESAWGGSIGWLKAEGVIVQTGDRKGATYVLA